MLRQPGNPPRQAVTPDDISEFLQRFIDVGTRTAEAMVDNLIRVRVGPAMNLQSVEILDSTLDPGMKQRLETAIVGAVNTAMQRATVTAGQALRDYARRQNAEKSDV
jgi:DNA-binding protein YbaB